MVRVVRLERTVSWSQTRRDTNFAIPGYSISVIIPRRGRKSKIFLSVVIYVVKTAFVPFSATGGNPANAGVARLCGVSPHPIPDTTTALPKQARYQLRYTRLYIVGLSGRPIVYPTARPFSRAFCTGSRKKCRTTIHLGQLNKKGMRNRASCVKVKLPHQTF